MAMGSVVDDWLEADGLILLESWARDGYTIQDIATRVGVSQQRFRVWMNEYPEIKKAVNNGRELVDYKVENALLKSALGYKTREVKVTAKIKDGKVVEETKETIDKEFAPNVSACQVWLYNRVPKKWKNMNSRANILDEIDEDTSIHITVERAGISSQSNGTSTSDDEVDEQWQDEVNKSITVRGMTDEEKQEAKAQRAQAKKDKAKEEEKFLAMSGGKKSKGKSATSSNTKGMHTDMHDTADTNGTDTDDLDYWPDDWEDEDE